MDRFEFFDIIPPMRQSARTRIQWAYYLAKDAHDGQIRDTGERYFEHVRGVAILLIEHGYTKAEFIILALLHDVLEDSYMPVSLLEELFGSRIARSILTVSKTYCIEDPLTGMLTRTPKRPPEQYFRSIRRNGKCAAIAKCADRVHNLRDLTKDQPANSRWTPEKLLRQVEETRTWILPLAAVFEPQFEEELTALCNVIELNAKFKTEASTT